MKTLFYIDFPDPNEGVRRFNAKDFMSIVPRIGEHVSLESIFGSEDVFETHSFGQVSDVVWEKRNRVFEVSVYLKPIKD